MLKNVRLIVQLTNFRTYASKSSIKKQVSTKTPLISCKVSKFDQYQETVIPQNTKFGSIPLASEGWKHFKAKGDYFTIHPSASAEPNTFPDKSFADFELDEQIVKNLKLQLDVSKPCSIQCDAIPQILCKEHTLIAAETGCGKTLAYLIPIVQQVIAHKQKQQNDEMNTPLVLILTPGRELGKSDIIIFGSYQIFQICHVLLLGRDTPLMITEI